MKNLLIAIALFGAAFFLAKRDMLPAFGNGGSSIVSLSDLNPDRDTGLELPQIGDNSMERMARQMDAIAGQLSNNPLMASGLIVKATEACLPDDTPDLVIASLARFVRVTSEAIQLPEAEREADILAKMLQLGQEFETSVAQFSPEDQQKALRILEQNMRDPATLFNCNAGWLRSMN